MTRSFIIVFINCLYKLNIFKTNIYIFLFRNNYYFSTYIISLIFLSRLRPLFKICTSLIILAKINNNGSSVLIIFNIFLNYTFYLIYSREGRANTLFPASHLLRHCVLCRALLRWQSEENGNGGNGLVGIEPSALFFLFIFTNNYITYFVLL